MEYRNGPNASPSGLSPDWEAVHNKRIINTLIQLGLDPNKYQVGTIKSNNINASASVYPDAKPLIQANTALLDKIDPNIISFLMAHEEAHTHQPPEKYYPIGMDVGLENDHKYNQHFSQPNPMRESGEFSFKNFRTRHYEAQADKEAQKKYLEAGGEPSLFVRGALGFSENGKNLTSTHPSTSDRNETLRNRLRSPDILALLLGRGAVKRPLPWKPY